MNAPASRWTRADIARLDHEDRLAHLRARFLVPEGVVYLDGNSLGCLPAGVEERIQRLMREEWGNDLIKSWNIHDWIDLPRRVGAKIARLIGAEDNEVVAADSTSVNLYKLLAAALKMRPDRRVILTEADNFPTDNYMMQGLSALVGGVEVRAIARDAITDAIDENVAVVSLTHVNYRTGQIYDMAGVTDAAHRAGALTIWDLSHSAGAVPVYLNEAAADFAVGCGYKFLNGGPGAPAYVFVASRHFDEAISPLWGWLGHAKPFDFSGDYAPGDGIDRFQCGTPALLSLVALDAALDAFDGVEIPALYGKAQRLGDLFLDLVDSELGNSDLEIACPRKADERGSQVSFTHPNAFEIVQALIDRDMIGDYRAPDIARFGLTPIYLRYSDIGRGVELLKDVMDQEAWRDPRYQTRGKVT